MTTNTKKIDTLYIFIFLLTLVVSIIIFTAFSLFRPEYTGPKYNFTPFPTITPKNVEDAQIGRTPHCTKTIIKCKTNSDCATCPGGNYECTVVDNNENVIVNGQKINPGQWCLPSGKKETGCGTYTGRAIWSDKIQGDQQWTCECLYPDLFSGNDCLTQIACIDPTITNIDQSNNKIVSVNDKHVWDPNSPDFDPRGRTPYDRICPADSTGPCTGPPMYKCSCDTNKTNGTAIPGTIQFVQMPNDLYRCHADPCTKNHLFNAFDTSTNTCDCSKISDQFAKSNIDGVCRDMTNICNWDIQNNKCKCEDKVVLCNSKYMYRDYPDCPDMENPGGSYCKYSCLLPGGFPYCENGGVGTVQSDGTCKCDCSHIPLPEQLSAKGDRCENICIIQGPRISDTWGEYDDPLPKPNTSIYCCYDSYIQYDQFGNSWRCRTEPA